MSIAAAPPSGPVPKQWQIARAIPAGARRAHSQRSWLAEVLADEQLAGFRADRRRHLEGLARVLARHMDWHQRTARPTWTVLTARVGVHRATVARGLVWLRERGYLGIVSSGWTPALRAASLVDPGDANAAAVYVLTQPGRRFKNRTLRPAGGSQHTGNATLSLPPKGVGRAPTRAREAGEGQGRSGARSAGAVPAAAPGPGPAVAGRRKDRAEGEAWAEAVRTLAPRVLGSLSARAVRSLGRRHRAAGWTPADFVWALWQPPEGRAWGFSAEVRHPAAWARARLAAWERDGQVLPGRSQRRAAAAAQLAAEQAAYRAAAAAVAEASADPTEEYRRAREELRRRPRAVRTGPAPSREPGPLGRLARQLADRKRPASPDAESEPPLNGGE